jgi:hypothetical protein
MESVDPADIESALKLLREARPFLRDIERALEMASHRHGHDESSPAMQQLDNLHQVRERVMDAIVCLARKTTPQR